MASQVTPTLGQVISDQLKTSTYVIELDVFSGLPNPTVVVQESKEHLMKMFADHKTFQSTRLTSTLGYRGFIVHKRTSAKGAALEISRMTVGKGTNAGFEQSLLQMFTDVDEEVIGHVKECFKAGTQSSEDANVKVGELSAPGLYVLPDYLPGLWNDNEFIQNNNNCYNYSTNIRTDTFAQPGRCHGGPPVTTEKIALEGCLKDGLKKRDDGNPPSPSENTGPIALVVWPIGGGRIRDFHFYRMDSNRRWSHKPGQTKVINTDSSGQVITDPESADTRPYTIFTSYLGNTSGVSIN